MLLSVWVVTYFCLTVDLQTVQYDYVCFALQWVFGRYDICLGYE